MGPTPASAGREIGEWLHRPKTKITRHLVATSLNVPLSIQKINIETDPEDQFPRFRTWPARVGSRTDVVLEFGDNVHVVNPETFGAAYDHY